MANVLFDKPQSGRVAKGWIGGVLATSVCLFLYEWLIGNNDFFLMADFILLQLILVSLLRRNTAEIVITYAVILGLISCLLKDIYSDGIVPNLLFLIAGYCLVLFLLFQACRSVKFLAQQKVKP